LATRTKSDEAADQQLADDKAGMVAAAKDLLGDLLPRGVHQKMNVILRTMPENMRPEGRNKHFDYDYWSLDQISGYFRNRFGDLGLSLNVDVVEFSLLEHKTAKGGMSILTTIKALFTITDSDTGEQVSGHGLGQGDDPGDKGANKAISGALKYWLLKEFIVGGEDSEADERTDRRAEERGRRRGPDDEDQAVVIGDSKIEGIQRGGRANKTTDAQLRQIRHLAVDLEWNAAGTARRVGEWLGDEIELPEEVENQPDALRRYLEGLSADDAGLIITKMVDLKDLPDEDEDDDDKGGGYGDYS
jgi:hypothetical protein